MKSRLKGNRLQRTSTLPIMTRGSAEGLDLGHMLNVPSVGRLESYTIMLVVLY